MKKCAEILFYSLAIILFACCGNNAKKDKETVSDNDITITPFEYHETFKLNENAIESPTLEFDMSLSLIESCDPVVSENINQAIAYTLFEIHDKSVKDACEKFVELRKREYMELQPEFIDIKNNDMPAVWFYNYYIANSEVERGYNGVLNYIIMWEEFTGGAHPNSYYTVLNFNPGTGEEIILSDILKENYEEPLTDMLINNLAKQLEVTNVDGIKEKGYLYQDTEMFISNNFILDNDKIVFIYNKYEIAPYALGDIMIEVTYNELKDLMK
ncbi:MAG: DUF3298 domain-containing protein [Bacteroidaceae bacterium]|nr:DUF3298 domain-containing protein [Bacteroidaceae bacterium]